MNNNTEIDEFIKTIIVEDGDSHVQMSIAQDFLLDYCKKRDIECPVINSYLFRLFPNIQYIKIDVDGARRVAFSRLKLIG